MEERVCYCEVSGIIMNGNLYSIVSIMHIHISMPSNLEMLFPLGFYPLSTYSNSYAASKAWGTHGSFFLYTSLLRTLASDRTHCFSRL